MLPRRWIRGGSIVSEPTGVVDLSDPTMQAGDWRLRIDAGVDARDSTPWVTISFQWCEQGVPTKEPEQYTINTDRAYEMGLRLIAASALAGQSSLIHELHQSMVAQGFVKEAGVVQDVLNFLQHTQEAVPEAET